jgi:hypothetical protein
MSNDAKYLYSTLCEVHISELLKHPKVQKYVEKQSQIHGKNADILSVR